MCAVRMGKSTAASWKWSSGSIIPPDLTASSGLDVAVVSSSSVILEPTRTSRERPKEIQDVILVKFVLLVSVHTTSVNGARFSEAPKFQVLVCLNVLQAVTLMESKHTNVWSRHSDSQIIIRAHPGSDSSLTAAVRDVMDSRDR